VAPGEAGPADRRAGGSAGGVAGRGPDFIGREIVFYVAAGFSLRKLKLAATFKAGFRIMKIEHFLTFLTVIVGILVAFIAYRQFVLANGKFKLDLFEKRFAIYLGVESFLTYVIGGESGNEESIPFKRLHKFWYETRYAPFFYNNDILMYLEEIGKKAGELHHIEQQMRVKTPEYANLVDQESELNEWFINQLPRLKDIFSPYLKFETWK
jgi:hypothetical protein